MKHNSQFIENAKAHLEQLGDDLSDLESKVTKAGKEADEWSATQVNKLKKDWEEAKTEMKTIATRIESEGEASVEDAKAKAERHWDALQAAVKAYRDHLEKSVAS